MRTRVGEIGSNEVAAIAVLSIYSDELAIPASVGVLTRGSVPRKFKLGPKGPA